MKPSVVLVCLLGLQFLTHVTCAKSSPSFVGGILGFVKNIPFLNNMVEKIGFSMEDLDMLFGQKNLFGRLIQSVYKLSPLVGQIIDAAAKTNVELRVVLSLARGKSPNLIDLFKLVSSTSENMFNSVDNAASENAEAQRIMQMIKEPNPNITQIWNMITGKHYQSHYVLDTGKYSIATSTGRKNRHLLELSQFIVLNWRPLEKAFRIISNLPINYKKVLHYFLTLDYSPIKFALNTAPKLNTKKYMVTDNKLKLQSVTTGSGFDPVVDEDILNVMHEIRVTYPSMAEVFDGPNGNDEGNSLSGV